ncbi:YiiD C-terminal domain-containing protein [Mangrovivirga sp. M17]|uniref:YiiD C-terminal domain-containing protein n=1 Tax=Mangrovivirga halotolerans TaxID=2993936 RepID=A0ABT3RMX6_9BACT|nr:YiiD C-terminal domain-containing protein [Mangrovivirga halotolerans]MCX2742863.1 YiiD C-terminal domain-containing protein [Mangrovivirga halotolerans]
MLNQDQLFEKAKSSSLYRKILNSVLYKMVPFNKPHRFQIDKIDDDSITVKLPYIKRNFNHIKGVHACALATVSEFSSGALLLRKLGRKYRIILQKLEMEYHYQGKSDCYATFSVDDNWLKENVFSPLESEEKIVVPCIVKTFDSDENLISTATIKWQIKSWDKVKTKA